MKCNIPSFVADFVKVEAWVDSDGGEYLLTDDIGTTMLYIPPKPFYPNCPKSPFITTSIVNGTVTLLVVNQFYEAEILTEYVIRGNSAVLKCSIPSFVADFVKVEAWIDEEGTEITLIDNLGKKYSKVTISPMIYVFHISIYPFHRNI